MQTDKYILQLRKRVQWLTDNPMLGRTRDEIKEGYRSFREGSHVIFYRTTGDAIEIIGILYQNMDIEQNLNSGNPLPSNIADYESEDG
jgi:toxin ParE1/3/4